MKFDLLEAGEARAVDIQIVHNFLLDDPNIIRFFETSSKTGENIGNFLITSTFSYLCKRKKVH